MATFNYKTIERVTAQVCENSVPIIAHSQKEQEEALHKFRTFIESDIRLRASIGSRSSAKNTWSKFLSIYLSNYDYQFPSIPHIQFDTLDRLVMFEDHFKKACPIDYTTFPLVINEMFKLHEIEQADKKKKQKMRDLKTQGILAKLNEIAKEDGFKFHAEQIPTRVKLTIELPENKLLKIDIPFSNFQEVMQKVRIFIQNSRKMAETGISFTVEKGKRP